MDTSLAHLGLDFWKSLDNTFKSHALLLCLDDDGELILQFFLVSPLTFFGPLEVRAQVSLAKSVGATSLVRIQKRPVNDTTHPFHIHSTLTRALYVAARTHQLPLTEVVLLG